MPTVHFLNVGEGDCSILQHSSGRVTMIDICGGNLDAKQESQAKMLQRIFESTVSGGGDYGMRECPTNPVNYCLANGIKNVFRFILTHPDMDHMDGLDNQLTRVSVANFWETGTRKEKPDFSEGGYKEEDWDSYAAIADRKREGITVLSHLAGAQFEFANKGEPKGGGDYLSIVAPSPALVATANESEDCNDASYVVVYRTCGGNIVFPGDAHDGTWEHVTKHYKSLVQNCGLLIAPHHGRKSDRDYGFLDVLKPGLTLFGCAPSEHLAYSAWSYRELPYITQNQAGNIILEGTDQGIEVFVENITFARTQQAFDESRTHFGCYYIGRVPAPVKQEQPA